MMAPRTAPTSSATTNLARRFGSCTASDCTRERERAWCGRSRLAHGPSRAGRAHGHHAPGIYRGGAEERRTRREEGWATKNTKSARKMIRGSMSIRRAPRLRGRPARDLPRRARRAKGAERGREHIRLLVGARSAAFGSLASEALNALSSGARRSPPRAPLLRVSAVDRAHALFGACTRARSRTQHDGDRDAGGDHGHRGRAGRTGVAHGQRVCPGLTAKGAEGRRARREAESNHSGSHAARVPRPFSVYAVNACSSGDALLLRVLRSSASPR
jgi:hypothetical protein